MCCKLLEEGYPVRLSGQDCKRGTFSSRHAVLFDYETAKAYEPLNSFGAAPVTIVNSPLSEQGCLGFEFGYAWLIGSEQNLSISIGSGATRLLGGESTAFPVLRFINLGWAF